MPVEIERRLIRQAKKRGLKPGTDRFNAYVYGTLQKIEKLKTKAKKKK